MGIIHFQICPESFIQTMKHKHLVESLAKVSSISLPNIIDFCQCYWLPSTTRQKALFLKIQIAYDIEEINLMPTRSFTPTDLGIQGAERYYACYSREKNPYHPATNPITVVTQILEE